MYAKRVSTGRTFTNISAISGAYQKCTANVRLIVRTLAQTSSRHFFALNAITFYTDRVIGRRALRIMAQIDQLFKIMVQNNASDLHLRAGSPPYLRLHGNMVRLNYRDLSSDEVKALIFEIISEKQQKEFTENWELDCSYAVHTLDRFRCNVLSQRNGLGGRIRVI